ncbi:hypothetical protein E2C01_064513 [Portunus trituberculatus]|uniref:Uncharacterized protein n=1 Tax=Portunus trituberculatus TaxID=210409 RepID=A0A5B7HC24_PORTR|nr:hypothetical protein [Portunus trituberculatus]
MRNERFLWIICLVTLSALPAGEASIEKILDKILGIGLEIGHEIYDYLHLRQPSFGHVAYIPVYGHGPPGYKTPEHHEYHEDVYIPVDPGTLWNGHIPVGDFVSPIVKAVGAGVGGYNNRVVKGKLSSSLAKWK